MTIEGYIYPQKPDKDGSSAIGFSMSAETESKMLLKLCWFFLKTAFKYGWSTKVRFNEKKTEAK